MSEVRKAKRQVLTIPIHARKQRSASPSISKMKLEKREQKVSSESSVEINKADSMQYSKTTEEYARLSHKINEETDTSKVLQRLSETYKDQVSLQDQFTV